MNISPALNWTQPPAGTAELALIVQDPDVPFGKPASHALTLGIDPSLDGIAENASSSPSTRPPGLPASFTLDGVMAAIKGHAIGRARLDGTYEIR